MSESPEPVTNRLEGVTGQDEAAAKTLLDTLAEKVAKGEKQNEEFATALKEQSSVIKEQNKKIQDTNTLTVLGFILGIFVVASVVVAVAAIILDQLHFNNQFYQNGYNLPKQTKYVTVPSPSPVFKKLP